jgi:Lrp/AsnC family leucine-responsive transcriptional regulator
MPLKMANPSLDKHSINILRELQGNSRIPSAEPAERVAMSTSPCWRRQKELEESGVIERYVALSTGASWVCRCAVSCTSR